jgi:hypothetical protein
MFFGVRDIVLYIINRNVGLTTLLISEAFSFGAMLSIPYWYIANRSVNKSD